MSRIIIIDVQPTVYFVPNNLQLSNTCMSKSSALKALIRFSRKVHVFVTPTNSAEANSGPLLDQAAVDHN